MVHKNIDLNDLADNKDILAFFNDNDKIFIAFKRKSNEKLFFDYRILTAMKVGNYLLPNIKNWFDSKKIKRDNLEMLLFFFDDKRNRA